jgi:Tol biopolymer transport system component
VWIADLSRGTTTRLTHGGVNTAPVWAGTSVLYASRAEFSDASKIYASYTIWKRDRDGAAPAELIYESARDSFPLSATPDSAWLTFLQTDPERPPAIWRMNIAAGTSVPLTRPPFEERAAALSPDGAFIAYESTEAGRWDVYVMRVGDGKRAVVSRAGGGRPLWAPDGTSLYYRSGRQLVRVAFDGRGDLRIGTPEPVPGTTDAEAVGVAPDGRLLIRRAPLQPAAVVVALGWVRELRQLLGPPPAAVPR